jgi:hypothetical protein
MGEIKPIAPEHPTLGDNILNKAFQLKDFLCFPDGAKARAFRHDLLFYNSNFILDTLIEVVVTPFALFLDQPALIAYSHLLSFLTNLL